MRADRGSLGESTKTGYGSASAARAFGSEA